MDHYLRDRIENITEEDFWSSIRPITELKPALEAAQSGKKSRAYSLLGKYHQHTLSLETEGMRKSKEDVKVNEKREADRKRSADMVVNHEIQGWHTQVIKFGPKIDFNADFGSSGQYGFHYLMWLSPVVSLYALTGETKYRDCFLDILLQYYEQRNKLQWRKPSLHPVYYELGAWSKIGVIFPAYAFLAGERSMGTKHREAALKLLLGMARSLYRLQRTGFRAGNWQIVGTQALFLMGCVFPEFKEAARWRKRSLKILVMHAKEDFFEDGCHGERCWGYGWMSLNGMITAYKTGIRYDRLGNHKTAFSRVLKKSFQWYAASVSPTLEHLNYGDGGIGDATSVFNAAKELFPEFEKLPGLLGVDRSKSRILYPSGYAFMVADDSRSSPYMSINFGKYGGGHTHRDLLDFTIWCYGEPIIEEVGRFGSYDNPLDRFFRSEQAHNQIVIENAEMDRRSHQGEDVGWLSTGEADFFSASHLAYEGTSEAKITRQIVFIKPDYWVIYDVLEAREKIFQVSSYLHAIRPFKILKHGSAHVQGLKSCLVTFANPDDIRRFTTGIDYSREDGPGSSGRAAERHRLVATSWRDAGDSRPITFATLIVPFKGKTRPRASIRSLPDRSNLTGQAEAFSVKVKGRENTIAFNPALLSDFKAGRRQIKGIMAAKVNGKWIDCPG